MEPAAMKVGVLLPIWTDSLDGQTPALAQALAFARHAEAGGSTACG